MAWPGISTKNTEKIPAGPNFWNPNKKEKQKMGMFGIFGVSFRCFRGILGVNSGSPEFRVGVFSRFFSSKFRAGPSRAL